MVPEAREEVEIDAPEDETGERPPAPPANPIPPLLPKQGQTSLQAVTGKNLDVRSLGTCHTCMDVAADFCSKCAAKAVVKVIAKTVTKADVVGKAVTKADAVDKARARDDLKPTRQPAPFGLPVGWTCFRYNYLSGKLVGRTYLRYVNPRGRGGYSCVSQCVKAQAEADGADVKVALAYYRDRLAQWKAGKRCAQQQGLGEPKANKASLKRFFVCPIPEAKKAKDSDWSPWTELRRAAVRA